MTRRLVGAALLALGLASVSSPAAAEDGGDSCKENYEQSQMLMRESSLLAARERLRACVRSSCKAWLIADCAQWLGDVEARIPTVVFSAHDGAGRDITDVRVTTPSGEPVVSKLDGRTVELEPGEREFVFLARDGARREARVIVREGARAQNIAVTFDAPASAEPAPPVAPRAPHEVDTPRGRPGLLNYAGYATAAAGVLGIGFGTVFGIRAIVKRGDANCDANDACDAGPLADARSAATNATVGMLVGTALLATGVTLLLVAPSSRASARATAAPGSTGIVIDGRF